MRLLGSSHDPNAGQAALAACAAALLSPKLQTDVFTRSKSSPRSASRSGVSALPALFVDDLLFAAAGLVEPLELVEFIGLSTRANPEKATAESAAAGQPGTATAWRPPPPAHTHQPIHQQGEPRALDPDRGRRRTRARGVGDAGRACDRTAKAGLIVPESLRGAPLTRHEGRVVRWICSIMIGTAEGETSLEARLWLTLAELAGIAGLRSQFAWLNDVLERL